MPVDLKRPQSRRALLAATLGGVAASAVSALSSVVGRPAVAEAAGDPVILGGYNETTESTTITTVLGTHPTAPTALFLQTAQNPALSSESAESVAVLGRSSDGQGVAGTSQKSTGVFGVASISPMPTPPPVTAVFGFSDLASATGVWGKATSTTTATYGVVGDVYGPTSIGVAGRSWSSTGETYGTYGQTESTLGRGVFGRSLNTSSGGTGVMGQADAGTGVGVRGLAWDGSAASGKFGTGVLGISGSHTGFLPTAISNTGVYGIGTHGRGGVFKGDVAPLRLLASTATTHPSSGAKGDFFVDSSGRLWYCKGGTTWKELA